MFWLIFQTAAYFTLAAIFPGSGLIFRHALVQFFLLACLTYPHCRKTGMFFFFQAVFAIYSSLLLGLNTAQIPVTPEMFYQFFSKFWHLRSSIASSINIWFVVASVVIMEAAIVLFILERRTASAPPVRGRRVIQTAAILLYTASVLISAKSSSTELPSGPPRADSVDVIRHADAPREFLSTFLSRVKELPSKRSVILIMVEAMRTKSLPLFGYERDTTPGLTRLAGRSILFKNHNSISPTSLNAMYTLLSGSTPFMRTTGEIPTRTDYAQVANLAQILTQFGYHSSYFIAGGADYGARNRWLAKNGFQQIVDWNDFPAELRIDSWKMSDRALLDRLFQTIETSSEPQFLLTFLLGTHHPYTLRPDHQPNYSAGATKVNSLVMRDRYDDCLHLVDSDLNEFMEKIDSMAPDRRPIVMIVGDHGDTFGKNLGDHLIATMRSNSLYQETLRVPLLIYDGGKPAVVDFPTSHTMIPALILSRLVDGDELFRDRLKDKKYEWLNASDMFLANPFSEHIYGVIEGNLKLIKYYSRRSGIQHELFDLASDPGEKNDLSSSRPEDLKHLGTLIDAASNYFKRINQLPLPNQSDGGQKKVVERLTVSAPKIDGLNLTINGYVEVDTANYNAVKKIHIVWGDGADSRGLFPMSHAYLQPGHYKVEVTAETYAADFKRTVEADIIGADAK